MTAHEHLANLLEHIHVEAVVVDACDVPNPGWVELGRPTHVVLDCVGEVMGRGMDADSAIADAVLRTLKHQQSVIEQYQEAIRNYRIARAALEELP